MTRPSPEEVLSETARLAYHLHWPLDTILDLEHHDRRRFLREAEASPAARPPEAHRTTSDPMSDDAPHDVRGDLPPVRMALRVIGRHGATAGGPHLARSVARGARAQAPRRVHAARAHPG